MNPFNSVFFRSTPNQHEAFGPAQRGLTLFAALSLVFAAALPCVSAKEGESDKDGGIQLRGLATGLFDNIDALELRSEEQQVGELLLSTSQLKNPTPVSTREFTLGMNDGKQFRPLGKVSLPQQGESFILVCTPIKNGYQTYVVRADDPDFLGNDIQVFNFTKHQVAVTLGTAEPQKIEPNHIAKLRPELDADAKFFTALFKYEKKGELLPFYNAHWPMSRNTRSLIIVYQQADDGRVMLHSVTDTLEP